MGMTIETDLSDIAAMVERLDGAADKAAAKGLYKGAGIVADALTAAIGSIQTEPFRYVRDGDPKRLASPQEKAALANGQFGIAKFKKNGLEMETSIGLGNAGYMHIMGTGSRSSGKTTPVPVIARSIESGTSFMQKQPFMRKAFAKTKGSAADAIRSTMEAEIQKAIDQ